MFPIVKLNHKTKTGLELCLKCVAFSGYEQLNSTNPILQFSFEVCEQSLLPFRNVENPELEDYCYKKIDQGHRDYSNYNLRIDLEVVNGVLQPILEQDVDELGNPAFEEDGITPKMKPKMIGNIDFWLKFGGDAILADLEYTLGQISQEPISTFYKE